MMTAEELKVRLEEAIIKEIEGTSDDFISRIHLTDLFGCPYRKWAYKMGRKISEEKAKALWRGRLMHDYIERYLLDLFPNGSMEKTFIIDLMISGAQEELYLTPDFVFEEGIIEIKRVRTLPFDTRRERWVPYSHDVHQLDAYMALLKKKKGFLIYYILTRNGLEVFERKISEERAEKIRRNIAWRLKRWFKEEPPRQHEYGWECRYCEFKRGCEGGR